MCKQAKQGKGSVGLEQLGLDQLSLRLAEG